MVALLTRLAALALACVCVATIARAEDAAGRHAWTIDVDLGYPSVASDLGAWTDGDVGKLRFGEGSGVAGSRVAAAYRGRAARTMLVHAVFDYVDGASGGVDVTEAYLEWRPVPRSPLQHGLRAGAFYPPLSLENGDAAWSSPFTTSYSAINTWLGEEIRPIGIEWSTRRRIGYESSPHELSSFAAAFYGNDPAGTLLFWRGWSVHDRQVRLNDRLPLPPAPLFGAQGMVTGLRAQTLEPFEEIDDAPGFYAGVEWRYAKRAMLQLAAYDNRADPNSFRDGQWSWRTRFRQLAAQLELPRDIGLVTQWMSGATYWLIAATPSGMHTPATELVRDDFEAAFVLLTKRLSNRHRISARYEVFDVDRARDDLSIDSGDAWTLAYRYEATPKLQVAFEWLEIDSSRDLWRDFYATARTASERQWRLALTYRLLGPPR